MLTITSVLALFSLLAVASGVFFISKKVKLPYTVLLVFVGLIIVPLANAPFLKPIFGFLDDLSLTPELLFYIFLPVLIFESAFNMNIRRMMENIVSIGALSILSLLLSAGLIALGVYFVLPLVGLHIPFIVALLFASIISATDPVAVLALFKEFGAPKRLTLIFEGESLFNDGTAVALFLVVFMVAEKGFYGGTTILDGALTFVGMIGGGVFLGLLVAFVFSRFLRVTRSSEFVSITTLIVSAHFTFILGELINEHGIFGFDFHVSSIIATTISALFLGNYSKHILSPQSDEYLEKSIGHLAFVVNSLVFILIGILFASSHLSFYSLWLPIVLTVLVVAIARALSVFGIVIPLNLTKVEAPIPKSWQYLLSWGSLRGALAVIVVLLIPSSYIPLGWSYAFTPQELLLALTIGCILFTLFVKALTIGPMIKRLGINQESVLQLACKVDMAIYGVTSEIARLNEQKEKGFFNEDYFVRAKDRLMSRKNVLVNERKTLLEKYGENLFEQSLHVSAIGIERKYLQDLYINQEINEKVYRRISGKLSLQKEKVECADHLDINPSDFQDKKDVFDRLVNTFSSVLGDDVKQLGPEEKFSYYRAQSIIARKVLKTLNRMQTQYGEDVFLPEVFKKTLSVYFRYQEQALLKMNLVRDENNAQVEPLAEALVEKTLEASKAKSLSYLADHGLLQDH